MTNLHWFPLYVFDWKTDEKVRLMGPIARAYYFDLLCYEWIEGSIPVDRNAVTALLTMPDDPIDDPAQGSLLDQQTRIVDDDAVLDQVLACFVARPSDGRLINPKLERVRIEQQAKLDETTRTASRAGSVKSEAKARAARENGRHGGRPRKAETQQTQQNPTEKPRVSAGVENKREKTQQSQSQSQIQSQKRERAPSRSTLSELPTDFAPKDSHRQLARELNLNLEMVFRKFCDHHASKGTKFKDWNSGLNTWLRREREFTRSEKKPVPGYVPLPSDYVSPSEQIRPQRAAAGAGR